VNSNKPSLDGIGQQRQVKTKTEVQVKELTIIPPQVSQSEERIVDPATPEVEPKPGTEAPAEPKAKRKHFWTRRWFKITAPIVAVLLIAGGSVAAVVMHHKTPPKKMAAIVASPTPPATPTPIYSPLTGLPTTTAGAQAPVIGVMIENLYPQARPQSGLGTAGLVYEALAEGGITRFEAIFQEPLPASLGPVRSLRPYFLDWGLEHNIPVVHAGGSQPALAEIGPLGLKDINALKYDGSYFYRITTRYAPHNLYTNNTLLTKLDSDLGFATAPTFTPFAYKADAPMSAPTHPTISITFSSAPYNVSYQFDPKTDSYARSMGGAPHIDANTNSQIFVKNIIVEYVSTSYGTQADGDPMTIMQLVGSGKALVFNDGGMTSGTWSKASDSAQTKYLDSSGNPIQMNRGNTWIDVVPTTNTVQY
jgi:hypothetical protein